MSKQTPRQIASALHDCARQAYGVRDQKRGVAQRFAGQPDWKDLTPEAQARRLTEARTAFIDALRPEVDRARELAASVLGDAEERLSTARYFRQAKFTDDATLEELTRIRFALELPKTPAKTLGAMARDCAERGGDAAAALLVLIRRERDSRVAAGLDMTSGEGLGLSVDVMAAEDSFPLPAAISEERDTVAEIRRTLDSIESAFTEVALPDGLHHDDTDRIEHYRTGGEPPAMPAPPKAERVLPFMVAPADGPTDQPSSKDAA